MIRALTIAGPAALMLAFLACFVWWRGRRFDRAYPHLSRRTLGAEPTEGEIMANELTDIVFAQANRILLSHLAAADALMAAAGPLGMAAPGPWEEADEALSERLRRGAFDFQLRAAQREGRLDQLAVERGLPRARLVRAEG